MSGTFKFKRFYSEGVAAEHPDIAGQKEFANKADAEITRRRKERAKKGGPQLPGFVASVKKEEVEVSEAKVDNSLSRSEKETARNKRAGITNNPYIGRIINFPMGPNFYVTKQGVAKWISNNDILNSLVSSLVSSAKQIIYLDIPWNNDYYTKGTQLPTNPPLIVGTPLKYGQSVGNEGSNVFVSKLIDQNNVDDIPDTYMGCYAASPNNDNMLFIGNKPSTNKVSIQNGNFDQLFQFHAISLC